MTSEAQTRATKKYEDKKGLISKSYKLPKVLTEQFAQACKETNKSQANVLSIFMQQYIDRVNSERHS